MIQQQVKIGCAADQHLPSESSGEHKRAMSRDGPRCFYYLTQR
jgi:hypothetical protein